MYCPYRVADIITCVTKRHRCADAECGNSHRVLLAGTGVAVDSICSIAFWFQYVLAVVSWSIHAHRVLIVKVTVASMSGDVWYGAVM